MKYDTDDIRYFIGQIKWLDEDAVQGLLISISCRLSDNQCADPSNGPVLQDAIDSIISQLDDMLEDIKNTDPKTCPACSGSGEGQYDGTTCSECRGKGEC